MMQRYGKVGTYSTAYGDNIDIYGVSLAKHIAGVSVGAELSYRQNMPLIASRCRCCRRRWSPQVPGSIATTRRAGRTARPARAATPGTASSMRCTIVPKTPLFDTATCCRADLDAVASVTQNEAVFKGRASYLNPDGTTPIDKVSKNYVGLALNFTPTWFQVFPGVDLSLPVTWSEGLVGQRGRALGGNKDAGN